jgi:Protein of unknown function, DUF547
MENSSITKLSEKLLLAVKMQEPTVDFLKKLEDISLDELKASLKTDGDKKAFWINTYNAFYQILRKIDKVDKPAIFTKKLICIAGASWSLDDIEHGILRRYRWKYSFGYLPNIFTSKLIKEMAVSKIDYRIHFALNCGAKSCPPIAFYSTENIEAQLEMATLSFLENDTDIFNDKKEIHVNRILKWFLGDFDGTKGIRKILNEKLKMNTAGFKLVFKQYTWDDLLDNYSKGE